MSEELNKTPIPKTVSWYNLRRELKGKSIEIGGNAPKKLRLGGGCTCAAGVGSPDEQREELSQRESRKRLRRAGEAERTSEAKWPQGAAIGVYAASVALARQVRGAG